MEGTQFECRQQIHQSHKSGIKSWKVDKISLLSKWSASVTYYSKGVMVWYIFSKYFNLNPLPICEWICYPKFSFTNLIWNCKGWSNLERETWEMLENENLLV